MATIGEQPARQALSTAHFTSNWLHEHVREQGGALYITNRLVISG
jgi:hypothetical protein